MMVLLAPSSSVRNLGVIFDDQLTFKDHITKTARSCRFALHNIRKIRPFLTQHAAQLLLQALVISRLDYCNDPLAGLPSCTIKPRAVVLESGLGLESGLETFFYRLGLVLDSLVFGLGLVSDLVIGLAKCSSWSRPSPAIYAFFFSFKTKTRLFRKWVM